MNKNEALATIFAANQALWDDWARVHLKGNPTYPVQKFLAGETGWESNLPDDIGSVKGKSMLHLQCHFGMDSLMWARKGAQVTGVDFSRTAIQGANTLNAQLHLDAEFIQSNIYDLPDVLEARFDIVLTYFGIIYWLPDLAKWAEIIAHFLKPGGFFYIADGHPFMGMIEGSDPDTPHPFLGYTYFTGNTPQEYQSGTTTYADADAQLESRTNYMWKHKIGDIVSSIAGAGLSIEYLHEFPYLFCDLFDWPEGGIEGRMEQDEDGWWWLAGRKEFIPMMFSLKAVKDDVESKSLRFQPY
jgi:SAM-dependent methyltransferase